MIRNLLMIGMVAVALNFNASAGVAGPVMDLTIRQTGPSPSLVDLSNGQRGSWVGDDQNEVAGLQPSGVGAPGNAAPSTGEAKTQHVSGHLRKNGTFVQAYARAPRRR